MAAVVASDHCVLVQSVILAAGATHIVNLGTTMLVLCLKHLLVRSAALLLVVHNTLSLL